MVIIHFNGLDMFLVGELNEKIHAKVAKAFDIPEEDLVFTASDSFVFFKGHEQTSFNLMIKVDAPVKYKQYEKKVADLLLEESKNYAVHARLLFSYYQEGNYYERVDAKYPEFIETNAEAAISEDNYDRDREYSEDEIYLGNVFEDDAQEKEEDEGVKPFVLNDFFKKK